MIYDVSIYAIVVFILFVLAVLGLSFFFARKSKSASGLDFDSLSPKMTTEQS